MFIYLLPLVHADLYMFAVCFPTWSWEQGSSILFLLCICTFCPDFLLELNNVVVDYLLTLHIAYSHIECGIESKHSCPCLLHGLMINLRSISLGTLCDKRKGVGAATAQWRHRVCCRTDTSGPASLSATLCGVD